MGEEQTVLTERQDEISPGAYRFVVSWAAGLLLLYAVGGFLGARLLRGYAAETEVTRQTSIEALTADPNAPSPVSGIPSGAKPVDVLVGLSMNRIGEFALKESAWTADFDLYFRWTGDAVKPGEDFRIINGQIVQREKGTSYQSGEERYAEYHVVAQITRAFDTSRFPFSDHRLFVQVEDATHGLEALRYVADKRNSGVSSEAIPRNVKLARTMVGAMVRSRGLEQSNPGVPRSDREARSQFFFVMFVVPDSVGIYMKMFQALFASVAVALIALYIKANSIDCRFGLPVGGFFASVSNNIYVATLLPHSDRITLTDMINTVSLFTIFLVLVQSVISLYIFDNMGRVRLSLFFDKVSFAFFLLGYVAVNLALPLAARPS